MKNLDFLEKHISFNINYGLHAGKNISEIPTDYLVWGIKNIDNRFVKSIFSFELYLRNSTDGKDHINIYSKGRTKIGRLLSNFAYTPFNHLEDGKFISVEGYWYWLSTKDEKLRNLSGFNAKKYGRIVGGKDWLEDEEFKRKIKLAIKCKIDQNEIDLSALGDLPLKHYYFMPPNIFKTPDQGQWIIDYIDELRKGENLPISD